jgi:hypothetical protein
MMHIGRIAYQDDDTESSGRQQQVDPTLNLGHLDVEAGRNDPSFVETAIQLNDYFSRAMIVDDFEFPDIA